LCPEKQPQDSIFLPVSSFLISFKNAFPSRTQLPEKWSNKRSCYMEMPFLEIYRNIPQVQKIKP